MPHPLFPFALVLAAVTGLFHPATPVSSPPERDRPVSVVSPSRARAVDTDPFRRHAWANYQGPQDLAWAPYQNATGTQKEALGYIALQPKAKWFGAWIPDSQIAASVHDLHRQRPGRAIRTPWSR